MTYRIANAASLCLGRVGLSMHSQYSRTQGTTTLENSRSLTTAYLNASTMAEWK